MARRRRNQAQSPATTRRSTRSSNRTRSRSRSAFWRWRRALFVLGLVGLASLSGLGYALSNLELPEARQQLETTFVCLTDATEDCNGANAVATLAGEQDRVPVALDRVPRSLIEAVVAAEDRDFFRHGGVDPIGIVRAAVADVRQGGLRQGGSTITQQYVKNVYLTRERTVVRKVREAMVALKLERKLPKEAILERYLNSVYFGRGTYGVGAAARAYFGKDISDLDLAESAYLAGLIRAPELADATKNPEEATRRRKTVLNAMLSERYIKRAERDAADKRPWKVPEGPNDPKATVLPRTSRELFGRVRGVEWGTEYFIDAVHRQLRGLGFTPAQIFGQGLRVYTTLDPQAQRAAWEAVTGTLNQPDDPLAALAAIDDRGYVRALVGGRNYAENKVNLALGREGGGSGRQAGSTMKPFVLASAVQDGISLQSKFESPAEFVVPRANNGKDWVVHNYGDAEHGILTLLEATRLSSNTVYAQLMREVGPGNVVSLAEKMGITSPLSRVAGLVLGVADLSPLELTSAYSTFARGGTHLEPTFITRVEDAKGNVLKTVSQPATEALSKEENTLVTYGLRRVIAGGTGTGANFGKPAAGKTGTTQDNRDAWFAGYTPNGWTASVWMGYDIDPATNKPRFMDSVHGRPVTGGSLPATIWRNFMAAWTDGVNVGTFPTPNQFPGKVLNEDLGVTTTIPPCPPGASSLTIDPTSTTAPCEPASTSSSSSSSSSSSTSTSGPSTTRRHGTTSSSSSTSSTTSSSSTTTTDGWRRCNPGSRDC